jgi:hypothetical protein
MKWTDKSFALLFELVGSSQKLYYNICNGETQALYFRCFVMFVWLITTFGETQKKEETHMCFQQQSNNSFGRNPFFVNRGYILKHLWEPSCGLILRFLGNRQLSITHDVVETEAHIVQTELPHHREFGRKGWMSLYINVVIYLFMFCYFTLWNDSTKVCQTARNTHSLTTNHPPVLIVLMDY